MRNTTRHYLLTMLVTGLLYPAVAVAEENDYRYWQGRADTNIASDNAPSRSGNRLHNGNRDYRRDTSGYAPSYTDIPTGYAQTPHDNFYSMIYYY